MANRTKAEKQHMDRVASLGCIICKKQGNDLSPAELHHIRDVTITGIGQRANNFQVIPLCVAHHRIGEESFHYSKKKFNAKWGSQKDLLVETLNLLIHDSLFQEE